MLDALLDILADRESGASEIERRLCGAWLAAEPADAPAALTRVTDVILERYPAMANLMGWADQMWGLVEAGEVGRDDRIGTWLEARLDEIDTTPIDIGRRLAGRLALRPVVFTLSRSGTILGALVAARLDGAHPRVLVAESRPEGEGLLLAADLVDQGIETAVLPDLTLASLLGGFRPRGLDLAASPEESMLLVGTDGITTEAFVNKAGTGALAREARAAGIPVIVAAGYDKLLPATLAPAATIAAEPWDAGRSGVPGRRFDFERVDCQLVDRFVLPDRELGVDELAEAVAEREVSRHMRGRLAGSGG